MTAPPVNVSVAGRWVSIGKLEKGDLCGTRPQYSLPLREAGEGFLASMAQFNVICGIANMLRSLTSVPLYFLGIRAREPRWETSTLPAVDRNIDHR